MTLTLKRCLWLGFFFLSFFLHVGKPEVKWLANGKAVSDSDDFKYQNAGDIYKLIVGEIFPEDGGVYTCTASNAGGSATSSTTICVSGRTDRRVSGRTDRRVSGRTDGSQVGQTGLR